MLLDMIRDTAAQDRPRPAPLVRRRWRAFLALAAVLVLGAGLFLVARTWLAGGGHSVDASRLRIAVVTRGPLTRDVVADGRLTSAKSPTLYAIAAGTVSLKVVAGDPVKPGQVLAIIDSPELKSRLAEEEASVARLETEVGRAALEVKNRRQSAQKDLEQAQVDRLGAARDLQKMEKAHDLGVVPEIDYLHAKDTLSKADIELKHAREDLGMDTDIADFDLKAKKLELDRQRQVAAELARQVDALEIRSPVDGQVGQVMVAQNESVAQNAPVLSVVDLTRFELEIQVPESFARDLAVGMPAEISGSGGKLKGRVRSVSPEVVNGQVVSRIALTGDVPDGLRQNQHMSARILLDKKADVLQVERGSFYQQGGGYAYFVVDGVAERRPLRTGVASLDAVEILEGARPGDRIVVSGADLFEDAERVRIAGE